jgi:hypothetical protein
MNHSGFWQSLNAFMTSDFMLGLVIGALIFGFWDTVAALLARVFNRQRPTIGKSQINPTAVTSQIDPTGHELVPKDIQFGAEWGEDGVDANFIVTIRNIAPYPLHLAWVDQETHIAGVRPVSGKATMSSPIAPRSDQKIRMPQIWVKEINKSVTGEVRLRIRFGPTNDDKNSILSFRYIVSFENYGQQKGLGRRISDDLPSELKDYSYEKWDGQS